MRITHAAGLTMALTLAFGLFGADGVMPPLLPGGPQFGPERGPGGAEVKLVKQFDKDGDKRLNAEERKAARAYLTSSRQTGGFGGFGGRMRGGPPGFGGRGGFSEPAQPGAKISPSEVKSGGDAPLYDPGTLRTLFLQFENADWEIELEDFYNTDVDVPASLTVDGKTYRDVGVHFRGNTSYQMVPRGRKRSLNLSLDFAHKSQLLGGYRTLNLLNSNLDPTYLRTVLYHQIVREYIPSPKANYARVVINGESWGIYVNVQQFNTDFTRDFFGSAGGARWKVPGGPGGRAGLEYFGDSPDPYKQIFEIKSKDDPESWKALVKLCRILNQEPVNTLAAAISPMLDIDGALKFLALDIAVVNEDGYWVRASDYSIYLDEKGRFHVLPYDTNETFAEGGFGMRGGGRGMRGGGFGGPGGAGGASLSPLATANNSSRPLSSKLLAVPALRAKYLEIIRDIAEKWLDWERLGPIARRYQALIAADVKADTKKLDTMEAFESGLKSFESFVRDRRAYLLSQTAPSK
jgi:hypothetical protein